MKTARLKAFKSGRNHLRTRHRGTIQLSGVVQIKEDREVTGWLCILRKTARSLHSCADYGRQRGHCMVLQIKEDSEVIAWFYRLRKTARSLHGYAY